MKSHSKITMSKGKLVVPDMPVIPFIEGDGTGPDIWTSAVNVFDEALEIAYSKKRVIKWKEVFAGEKALSISSQMHLKRDLTLEN